MNRFKQLFEKKQNRVLNIYCTSGYPALDDTLTVMKSLESSGADIIELGMPYSDPLADGLSIQQSSEQALGNGMSVEVLLKQLQGFRKSISIPVVLMGYLNPVLQFGFENFCAAVSAIGIDGLIIPDLPLAEFEKSFKHVVHRYGLDFIFLVTPDTPDDRIQKLDAASTGFLYAVSSGATTGTDADLKKVALFLKRLRKLQLKNRVLVGFGIHNRESFELVCRFATGAVIGSAYIRALGNTGSIEENTETFIAGILR
jgi:tryptophan synthase alpha chain